MKTIKITCDYCEKEIDPNILHGTLKFAMTAEANFCGFVCFDDWVKEVYLPKTKAKHE
jgi:hypothetical protein